MSKKPLKKNNQNNPPAEGRGNGLRSEYIGIYLTTLPQPVFLSGRDTRPETKEGKNVGKKMETEKR